MKDINVINGYEISSIHTDRNMFTYTVSPLGTPCWQQCGEGHVDFLRFESALELINEAKRNVERIHVGVKGVEGLIEIEYEARKQYEVKRHEETLKYVKDVIETKARVAQICKNYLAA